MRDHNKNNENQPSPARDLAPEFTVVYNTYHHRVREAAYRFCRCKFASEEVTQEVFVKLWIKKDHLHEIKDLDSWLFMMARNLSIDHLRKQKLEQTFFKDYSFVRSREMYSDDYVSREMQKIITEAVEQLHPQQKRVYQLKRYYGWKREEIAKQLDISENTVKATMQKALSSVKKYVKERVE